MAIDKNKIAAPVAITDPYNLLGIYPANGVWDVADIVALERPLLQGGRPGRINKWSRHKPVRYPRLRRYPTTIPNRPAGSRHISTSGKGATPTKIRAYAMG